MSGPVSAPSIGYQQMSSLSTATAPTAPKGSQGCTMIAETQSVRWRDDGTSPTAAIGMLLPTNTIFTYFGDPSKLKFIETSASAKLNLSFF